MDGSFNDAHVVWTACRLHGCYSSDLFVCSTLDELACLLVCLLACLFVCLFVCRFKCLWNYGMSLEFTGYISALGPQWSQRRIGLRICALIARLYRTRWQHTWVICKTWELLVWDWMLPNIFQDKTWQRSLRRSVCSKAITVGFSDAPDIVL